MNKKPFLFSACLLFALSITACDGAKETGISSKNREVAPPNNSGDGGGTPPGNGGGTPPGNGGGTPPGNGGGTPPGGTSCPTNYEYIAANSALGTSAFCIAKFEMKNNGGGFAVSQAAGTPYIMKNASTAQTKCSDIGAGYRLISNSEWNAAAVEIAGNAHNYSGTDLVYGFSGWSTGLLAVSTPNSSDGTSDGHRRAFYLGSDKSRFIWDFGGNAWEWVKDSISSAVTPFEPVISKSGYLGLSSSFWFPQNSHNKEILIPFAGAVNASFGSFTNVGSTGNMVRGSGVRDYGNAGIFSGYNGFADGTGSNDGNSDNFGFRCVSTPY